MPRYVSEYVITSCPRITASSLYAMTDVAGSVMNIGISPRYKPDALGTLFPSGAIVDAEVEAADLDEALATTAAIADLIVVLNECGPTWLDHRSVSQYRPPGGRSRALGDLSLR